MSKGAKIYAGIDLKGELLPGYPSSPLLTGAGPASFDLTECQEAGDPAIGHHDVDSDGFRNLSYRRADLVAHFDQVGSSPYMDPSATENQHLQVANKVQGVSKPLQLIQNPSSLVTDRQNGSLAAVCGNCLPGLDDKQLAWLNSKRYVNHIPLPLNVESEGQSAAHPSYHR